MAKQKYHEEEAKKDVSAIWYQSAHGAQAPLSGPERGRGHQAP